ncbi:helix-turn-helix transcriptional regulator [Streptomyces glaucus]
MAEQQRGRRAIEVGPTGQTVAANIARLRKRREMTTRQLSAALERAGRSIPASGITRMEKGERVVTADELTALAVVLGVSPVTLLLPANTRGPKDVNGLPTQATTEVTGAGEVGAADAWRWAWCMEPLRYPVDVDAEEADRLVMDFLLNSRPVGLLSAEGDDRVSSAAFGVRRGRESDG